MRFEVYNGYRSVDESPCNGAERIDHGKRTYVDERTVADPEQLPFPTPRGHSSKTEYWLSEGTNHRVEDGHIKRDKPLPEEYWYCWILDLNELSELLAFVSKVKAKSVELRESSDCINHPSGLPLIIINEGLSDEE